MIHPPRLVLLAVLGFVIGACTQERKNPVAGPQEFRAVWPGYTRAIADLPLKERELEAWRASEGIKTASERVPATLYYAPSAEADFLASEADRARSLGAEVLYSYEGYPALLVAAPGEALEALVMHSSVEAVVFSRAGEFTGDFKNYSYGLVENAGHGFVNIAQRGAGLNLAITDTGVECGHPDLPCPIGLSWSSRGPHTEDDCNHGTAVYSVVMAQRNGNDNFPYGYAPDATTTMYRVDELNSFGVCIPVSGYIAAAIDKAATAPDMLAISMSVAFGSPQQDMQLAIDHAFGLGILHIAAAGNTNGGPVTFPANYGSVFAVGALQCQGGDWVLGGASICTSHLEPSSFTASGPEVDIAAAGTHILLDNNSGGASFRNGTSFSAPTVAAAAVLLMQLWPESRHSPFNVMNHFKSHAYTGTPGFDPNRMGAGVLDVVAALSHDPCASECSVPFDEEE